VIALGKNLKIDQVLLEAFQPQEGVNAVYYGKVRNGKTRTATADILGLLERGEVVYANWTVKFDGFDERFSMRHLFWKTFGFRKLFFSYGANNFHYIDRDELISGIGSGESNVNYLNKLVGVHVFIDEGQWVLPSQDRSWDADTVAKMKLVLHGGHYCRTLNIITQRASNISKTTRSQIHFWYRCVKKFDILGVILFQRWEIEDMKEDMPVEMELDEKGRKKKICGRRSNYWVWKRNDRVFKAYDTHAMRGEDAIVPKREIEAYELNLRHRIGLFLWLFMQKLRIVKPLSGEGTHTAR